MSRIVAFYGQKNANNCFDDESCQCEYRNKLETRVGPSATHGDPSQANECLHGFTISGWRIHSQYAGDPIRVIQSRWLAYTLIISETSFWKRISAHRSSCVILSFAIYPRNSLSYQFHPSDSINAMVSNTARFHATTP